ncbi:MAG: response regulator [Alphaproteobacteria bacterium]
MARILLAEDDDSMRAFLKRALEKAGHEVDAVADGVEALAALIADRFDLLLADIVMPGLDGIELARRAAEDDPGLRVVLITGFAAVALRANREAPPGAQVLSKPMHLRELVTQVDEILAA